MTVTFEKTEFKSGPIIDFSFGLGKDFHQELKIVSGSSTRDALVCDGWLQDVNNTDRITSARWICRSPCEGCWMKNAVGCVVGMACTTSWRRVDHVSKIVGHTVGIVMWRVV